MSRPELSSELNVVEPCQVSRERSFKLNRALLSSPPRHRGAHLARTQPYRALKHACALFGHHPLTDSKHCRTCQGACDSVMSHSWICTSSIRRRKRESLICRMQNSTLFYGVMKLMSDIRMLDIDIVPLMELHTKQVPGELRP